MKSDDYSLSELPELEETEFTRSFSRRRWNNDGEDLGEFGDSFSIGLDSTGADEMIVDE